MPEKKRSGDSGTLRESAEALKCEEDYVYFVVDCNCSCYRLQTAGFTCTPFVLSCHVYFVIVKVKNVKERREKSA